MKLKTLLASTAILASSFVSATPVLDFIIDGNTFTQPFSITNSSDAGEQVTRFQLDLSTAINPICFDPDSDSVCNDSLGVSLSPVNGTGADTGYLGGSISNVSGGVDAWDYLDVSFNDFDSGETFSWDVDVDFFNGTGSPTVYGNQMIGATAFVDFSNGLRLTGFLAAVDGNSDASAFTVTGVAPTPVPEPGSLLLVALGLLFGRRLISK